MSWEGKSNSRSPAGEAPSSAVVRAPRPRISELHDDVSCIVCGSANHATLFHQPPFRIVRCQRCTLVYTLPRLPSRQIQEMYQVGYWRSSEARHFGYTDYLRDRELYHRTFQLRGRAIRRHKRRPGCVLDVGCAAGFFLNVMRQLGWEVAGVEISRAMVDFARGELGLQGVVHGTLVDQPLVEKSFDVVTLWDVIEHLEDPRPVLAAARRLLKDDGILLVETQNVTSLFARMMGRRWHHYKFEEHLWHFSPRTLARLLSESGFEVIESSARRAGKFVSLDFIVERSARVHPLLPRLLGPVRSMGKLSVYVNPMDEMIAIAKKR